MVTVPASQAEAISVCSMLISPMLEQASLALAVPVLAGELSSPIFSETFIGQVMSGSVVSSIVMVWSHVVSPPLPSSAFQVRMIVPVLPQLSIVTSEWEISAVPQLSEPVADPLAAGVVSSPHSTVFHRQDM